MCDTVSRKRIQLGTYLYLFQAIKLNGKRSWRELSARSTGRVVLAESSVREIRAKSWYDVVCWQIARRNGLSSIWSHRTCSDHRIPYRLPCEVLTADCHWIDTKFIDGYINGTAKFYHCVSVDNKGQYNTAVSLILKPIFSMLPNREHRKLKTVMGTMKLPKSIQRHFKVVTKRMGSF
jgi:hypothetical protein